MPAPHDGGESHANDRKPRGAARTASTRRKRPPATPPATTLPRIELTPIRPTTPGELHVWLRERTRVFAARSPLIQTNSAPFDYLCHTYFEGRVPGRPAAPGADCVVWANRGGGKTFLGAVATFLDLWFKPGVEVRILGGSLEQSRRMYEHLVGLFDIPEFKPAVLSCTQREIRLQSGSRVQILAASETAIRGTRVQKVRCDEVDIFDPEIWRAAQLATRSLRTGAPWSGWVRGSVEALSTMHRPMGLMWEVVDEALPGAASGLRPAPSDPEPNASRSEHRTPGRRPQRVLFRWGIVDALERCDQSHDCTTCVLHPECGGKAKERPADDAGHIGIDDAVELKSRTSLPVWQSEMLCQRVTRSHSVFPEFDLQMHVFAGEPHAPLLLGPVAHATDPLEIQPAPAASRVTAGGAPAGTLICGMDFGFRAPTVVLWARVSPDGVVRVIAEHVVAEMRVEEHIAAILRSPLGTPAWVGIDPAGEQREMQSGQANVDVLRRHGLVVKWVRHGVAAGLNLVRARLAPATLGIVRPESAPPPHTQPRGETLAITRDASPLTRAPLPFPSFVDTPAVGSRPTLFVSKACPQLIEALLKYHYDESRPESLDPVKDGHDHAIDALRYLVGNLDRPYRAARGEYVPH